MLTKTQIEKNKQKIIRLFQETERPGIDNLIGWLEGTDFFIAPGSSSVDKHSCHEGGLARHSLNVYGLFEMKAATYDLGLRDDERTIASLCHDFCKIGFYTKKEIKQRGKETKEAKKLYDVEDKFPFGHGEKSALLVSRHIDLTVPEALLIRWHMGQFDPAWDEYQQRKVEKLCPAIYAFQFADHEASKYVDARVVKQQKGSF